MTFLEAKQALAGKLNINLANIANNSLFSESDLDYWVNVGVQKAWDYKPWPFAVKTKTTQTDEEDYYDHPQDIVPHSIFRISVGNRVYPDPVRFEDYKAWREQNPNSPDQIWSMHENFVFINRNSYALDEALDMTGKKFPPHLSNNSDLMPFSPTTDNQEHSGNHAVIQFAYAEALGSDKLKRTNESEVQEKKAYRTLDLLWKPYAFQQAFQHSIKPMFNVSDFFRGGRHNHPPGNFNFN